MNKRKKGRLIKKLRRFASNTPFTNKNITFSEFILKSKSIREQLK